MISGTCSLPRASQPTQIRNIGGNGTMGLFPTQIRDIGGNGTMGPFRNLNPIFKKTVLDNGVGKKGFWNSLENIWLESIKDKQLQ